MLSSTRAAIRYFVITSPGSRHYKRLTLKSSSIASGCEVPKYYCLTSHAFTQRKEIKPRHYWKEPLHCRIFFDEVAKEKGFNPLDAASWHVIKKDNMLARKVDIYMLVLIHNGGLTGRKTNQEGFQWMEVGTEGCISRY